MMPNLPTIEGLTLTRDAPLGPRTTYKVGGPADLLAEVDTPDALRALLAALADAGTPWLVVGNGSNLLVSDAGYRGCVILLGAAFRQVAQDGPESVRAGGGLSITRLLRFARGAGLGGLELLGGVPGTVGGAVRMNAGTRYGQTSEILLSAEITTRDGVLTLPREALGLDYRRSQLPEGAVVTAATFLARPATEEALSRYDSVLAYRKATQPLQFPSCGSVFANPPGDAAGRLIEAAGLKGRRVGEAQIAEQHANWILNLGQARAADVLALIRLAQAEVEARFGITLRPEVRLVGDFEEPPCDDGRAA